jgi:lipoprotein-releasing system permease protein
MSKLPFELLLALRYLRPKRTFVSIITLISVLGVMLGVAVLIIVISVMSGFDRDLREKVFGFTAHLKIQAQGHTMENYALVASTVASNRNVTGVTPFVLAQVILETQPAAGEGMVLAPVVRGADPQTEGRVNSFITNIVEGAFDVSGRGLVIGLSMARHLRLQVGDRVSVWSPRELQKMRNLQKQGRDIVVPPGDYRITGIFDAGYEEFNALYAVTSLENAQEFFGLEEADTVHGLMASVRDPLHADVVARELARALGGDFRVTTWLEDSPLMAAVMVEKNVMLYILFFIVLVAAFGITCTLITFIVMKTREIGLLKALGASSAQVMWVFLGQSLIVSVLGILAGTGLGLLAITYRNEFLNFMRRSTGFQLFPADIYGFSQLPAQLLPGDLAIICGGSLVICLLAAAFPAWHASKLNPVEALRHE